jgi:hypothetical protein
VKAENKMVMAEEEEWSRLKLQGDGWENELRIM